MLNLLIQFANREYELNDNSDFRKIGGTTLNRLNQIITALKGIKDVEDLTNVQQVCSQGEEICEKVMNVIESFTSRQGMMSRMNPFSQSQQIYNRSTIPGGKRKRKRKTHKRKRNKNKKSYTKRKVYK